ncbi:MAG: extracellular solute-binding protein [Elusimicrobia bacterium]|nr:extracellular solute-binding protein [Elusimicrobiota bacterium]
MKKIFCLVFFFGLFMPLTSCSKKAEQKADVSIWHWMTDRQDAFEKLAAQYEKENGVKVIFETYAPSEVYRDKVRAAASGKLLPEIYSPLGDKRELAAYINSGYVADLTDEMNKGWKNIFFNKPLGQSTYSEGNEWKVKPGIYGVPFDVNAILIFYNKDLFKKAGLDPEKPPKTWNEFIETGKKLKAAGIQPFATGFGEPWLVGAFVASYEWNLLGKEGMIDTIKGKIKYTDPLWIRVIGLLDEMRKNGMFAAGVATMVNKDAERTFATGRAAMAFNGSWGVNVYRGMNPQLNYGVMLPPSISDAKHPLLIFGGEGSSFNINPNSPNKEKAIAFLKWLTAKEQQLLLAEETLNIPSNKQALENLSPILKEFARNIEKTFPSLPVVESWQVTNVINTGLQAIIIGEKNPETIAKEIQTEKENQQKKNQLK